MTLSKRTRFTGARGSRESSGQAAGSVQSGLQDRVCSVLVPSGVEDVEDPCTGGKIKKLQCAAAERGCRASGPALRGASWKGRVIC